MNNNKFFSYFFALFSHKSIMINEGYLVETMDHDYDWSETRYNDMNYSQSDSDSVSVSVSTVSTNDTETKKNKIKNRFGVSYKNDKNFFKIKSTIKGIPSISAYSTSILPGATIRNAVSGYLENDYAGRSIYKVGSINEELFFKANVSINGISGEPRILFYDSPEQYERHFRTTLSDETKNIWREKYNKRVEFNEQNKKPEESYHEIR